MSGEVWKGPPPDVPYTVGRCGYDLIIHLFSP